MNLTFWKKREDQGDETGVTAEAPEAGLAAVATPAPAAEPQAQAGSGEGDAAAPATGAESDPSLSGAGRARVEAGVIEALSGVFDPEIPVNIYELGLIYDIEITPQSDVVIDMTLTSPACPVAGSLPGEVEAVVSAVAGVRAVDVHLVWDPPWTPDRMSEAAKLELGFM